LDDDYHQSNERVALLWRNLIARRAYPHRELLIYASALSAAHIQDRAHTQDYYAARFFVKSIGVVMSRNWMMLTGLLLLGPLGTSQAHPLDSPDIVYIDGLPCNSACQSYMDWSWRQSSAMVARPARAQPTRHSSYGEIRRASAMRGESSKTADHIRTARQAMPSRPAKTAELHPAGKAAVASEPAPANVAPSPPAGVAATSNAKAVQEQIAAATTLAERLTSVTAAPVPQQQAGNAEASGPSGAADASRDSKPAESATADNTDNLVALLITGPAIKSVSDLSGKEVAIEDRQSASDASIRTAIAAAGATDVQLNAGHAKALERLIAGEVPAAVLTLVSPEAAEGFPDIPGFTIFRVPLAPRH
jgi:hypothetical protein